MMLVTIGTMLPFDRLIVAVDRWAAERDDEIFAQIGAGRYEPRHMKWARLLPPRDFVELARRATIIVSHAGTGSYFLAAEMVIPIVMLPRLAEKGEHTTDHQVHTARWLACKPGVYVADTEAGLPYAIERARQEGVETVAHISPHASAPFIARLRDFIER